MTDPFPLPIENGEPVYTFALALYIPNPFQANGNKVWKMHEDVALAMKELGLVG